MNRTSEKILSESGGFLPPGRLRSRACLEVSRDGHPLLYHSQGNEVPLYPCKRTIVSPMSMSAKGQTRSFGDVGSMSGLPESGHGGATYEYTPWHLFH